MLARIQPRAKDGHANAQYNLGVMYANGYGVEQSWAKARQWYRKAAEQHQARAEQNLGVMYAQGRGVAADKAEAVHWFGRAARDGQAAAQNNLAVLYARGDGVDQDLGQAAIWAVRAVRGGNAEASNNLSRIVGRLPHRYVASNGTAMHSSPDAETQVKMRLKRNTAVARLESKPRWTRVLLLDGHRLGWIKARALRQQKTTEQTHSDELSANGTQDQQGQPAQPSAGKRGHAVSGAAAKQIVAADSVNVHGGPARSAPVKFQVSAGDHATVKRAWQGWMLATFSGGREGWIAGFLLQKRS
ncbi:hypothetical protein HKX42_02185 [Salinisphaera sp. USBA-960]|uniref:SEL1-like repeat protein n=1 Tax=Salinisphaera orenii TaxID=856731 RepID=UPI000DBE199A|nr:hypothetical protein [Salifodinibacter halophilus]NNC25685.1 hypothetical protein [Salifodinibacter halophilus]